MGEDVNWVQNNRTICKRQELGWNRRGAACKQQEPGWNQWTGVKPVMNHMQTANQGGIGEEPYENGEPELKPARNHMQTAGTGMKPAVAVREQQEPGWNRRTGMKPAMNEARRVARGHMMVKGMCGGFLSSVRVGASFWSFTRLKKFLAPQKILVLEKGARKKEWRLHEGSKRSMSTSEEWIRERRGP